MVDRFLAALHGDDGRRHQQVRQFPYGALAACEQVASHVQRGNWGRPAQRSEAAKLASSEQQSSLASHTGSIIGSKRFSNWSSERMAR